MCVSLSFSRFYQYLIPFETSVFILMHETAKCWPTGNFIHVLDPTDWLLIDRCVDLVIFHMDVMCGHSVFNILSQSCASQSEISPDARIEVVTPMWNKMETIDSTWREVFLCFKWNQISETKVGSLVIGYQNKMIFLQRIHVPPGIQLCWAAHSRLFLDD